MEVGIYSNSETISLIFINFTQKQLINANFYLGNLFYKTESKAYFFIKGFLKNFSIINLGWSVLHLKIFFYFLESCIKKRGVLWFFCNSRYLVKFLSKLRKKLPFFFWKSSASKGGMLTNCHSFFFRDGVFRKVMLIKKKFRIFPSAVFLCDVTLSSSVLWDSKKLGISCGCLCDSDMNPDIFSYFFPGNNDSLQSGWFLLSLLIKCYLILQQEEKSSFLDYLNLGDTFWQ